MPGNKRVREDWRLGYDRDEPAFSVSLLVLLQVVLAVWFIYTAGTSSLQAAQSERAYKEARETMAIAEDNSIECELILDDHPSSFLTSPACLRFLAMDPAKAEEDERREIHDRVLAIRNLMHFRHILPPDRADTLWNPAFARTYPALFASPAGAGL